MIHQLSIPSYDQCFEILGTNFIQNDNKLILIIMSHHFRHINIQHRQIKLFAYFPVAHCKIENWIQTRRKKQKTKNKI